MPTAIKGCGVLFYVQSSYKTHWQNWVDNIGCVALMDSIEYQHFKIFWLFLFFLFIQRLSKKVRSVV